MNKTEKKAERWLEERGFSPIFHGRGSPDFTVETGDGYEVKFARRGQIVFTSRQLENLNAFSERLWVLIYPSMDAEEPSVFGFSDVLEDRIAPFRVHITKSGTNIAIRDDLHRQVKIRAAETRKTVTELVEAALRVYLAL